VVKHVYAAEQRVVVAVVLAADALLATNYLTKLLAHLATTLVRLNVHNHAQRSSLEAGSTRMKKNGRSGRT
jgi:hypothetical protein